MRSFFLVALIFLLFPLQRIHGQSQLEMNRESRKVLKVADAKLNRVYKEIMASNEVMETEKKNLRIAQRAWLAFVEAELATIFPVEPGEDPKKLYGSIYPMEWASAKTTLVKERIQQLEQLLPEDSEKVSHPDKRKALKSLRRARKDMQVTYRRVLKENAEYPGFESILKQSQLAWEAYVKWQLFSQFPLKKEEAKHPEKVYGPAYYAQRARAEIQLIEQRIVVLEKM
jgi:uncharacterized protein YecT (DUF1311 family)